jgi:ABC-type nitrate/sulfonate/bicarbonate transport system substrate-binding protein
MATRKRINVNIASPSKPARLVALLFSLPIAIVGCTTTELAPVAENVTQEVTPTTACTPDGTVNDVHTLVVGESTGVISEPYIAWGIKERCFEKYGLEIKSVAGSSQSARIAGLVGGSLDVAAQHVRFITQAMGNGEFNPLFVSAHFGVSEEILKRAQNTTTFDGELVYESTLVAGPDSGISDWGDLDGRTIGVINVTSTDVRGLSVLSGQSKLDLDSVTLVQLDQQEILNGLLRGDLDAGIVSGALALEAINKGGTLIGYPAAFFVEPGVLMAWVANAEANAGKREALLRFQEALWEIYFLLQTPENREDLLDLMEKEYALEPATRAATRLPELMPRQLTPQDFEGWIPKMIESGDIDAGVEFTDSMFLRR